MYLVRAHCFQFPPQSRVRLPLSLDHHRIRQVFELRNEVVSLGGQLRRDRWLKHEHDMWDIVSLQGAQFHRQRWKLRIRPPLDEVGNLLRLVWTIGRRGRSW